MENEELRIKNQRTLYQDADFADKRRKSKPKILAVSVQNGNSLVGNLAPYGR